MDFMHISGQKEGIWNTLFSIFERWRAPQTSRGPGKLYSLPSRLSTGLAAVDFLETDTFTDAQLTALTD